MKKNVILAMSLAVALGCGSIAAYAAETTETTPLTNVEAEAAPLEKTEDATEKSETTPLTNVEAKATTEKTEATTETAETEAVPVETIKVEVSYDKKELPVVNDVVFVPLRDSADALKLNVAWDAKTRTATLSNDTRSMKLTEGKDLYVSTTTIPDAVGMTKPVELGAAPYVAKDGKMYIPAKAYAPLVGYEVSITDTNVVIAQKGEAIAEATPAEKVEATTEKKETVPAEKLVPAEKVEDKKVEDKKEEATEKTEDKKEEATEKTEAPAEKA